MNNVYIEAIKVLNGLMSLNIHMTTVSKIGNLRKYIDIRFISKGIVYSLFKK